MKWRLVSWTVIQMLYRWIISDVETNCNTSNWRSKSSNGRSAKKAYAANQQSQKTKACTKIDRDHSKYSCVSRCPIVWFCPKSLHSAVDDRKDCLPVGERVRGDSVLDVREFVDPPIWRRNLLRWRSNLVLPKCWHMGCKNLNMEERWWRNGTGAIRRIFMAWKSGNKLRDPNPNPWLKLNWANCMYATKICGYCWMAVMGFCIPLRPMGACIGSVVCFALFRFVAEEKYNYCKSRILASRPLGNRHQGDTTRID